MQKTALITGITGQDGRYLSHLLVGKGYKVYGLVRNTNALLPKPLIAIYGDICSPPTLPLVDEIYNLAAITHVGESFKSIETTYKTNALAAIKLMEWAVSIKTKFYQASTSEMFGNNGGSLHEDASMNPVSPYGQAKLAAHNHAAMLRESGNFVCAGILFNHESPLRGANFVTAKIANAARNKERVTLGNIESCRDWGHAKEYVEGMWRMMQVDYPNNYVLATGQSWSIKDVLNIAYGKDWENFVDYDRSLERPREVYRLRGSAKRAKWSLGWNPVITIKEIIEEMIKHGDDTSDFWPKWMNPIEDKLRAV